MGPGVFHGEFTTLTTICFLGFTESYIFYTFFKLWLGMIVFAIGNSLLILPATFSLCGPSTARKIMN